MRALGDGNDKRADTPGDSNLGPITILPDWLPDAVRLYLDHTEDGLSLRALARRDGLHASTVMRHVRRCEMRRDDPLVDEALACLEHSTKSGKADHMQIQSQTTRKPSLPNDQLIHQEALRVLRRLSETGAFLAIAPDMEKAAVMRSFPDGRVMRMAVVDRSIAQAFALKDWIACKKTGRVTSYEITATGRAELRMRLETRGLQEASAKFSDQSTALDRADMGAKRPRYNLAESPVAVLGRRRDKDGKPYLEPDWVRAAERLREDFELSQMGPRVAQNWDRFLTCEDRSHFQSESGVMGGDARARVAAALLDLGPGLGDVVLRVCCYLEGVELTEQRLGWAARSGKVVLRIALQRLWRHYQETYGRSGPLIG
jgi:lambda repressor-like predicted transcriptional regulator